MSEQPVRGVKPAIWASSMLVELVRDLTSEDDCWYDHHGYCQAHLLHERPCPHEQAKAFRPLRSGNDQLCGGRGSGVRSSPLLRLRPPRLCSRCVHGMHCSTQREHLRRNLAGAVP